MALSDHARGEPVDRARPAAAAARAPHAWCARGVLALVHSRDSRRLDRSARLAEDSGRERRCAGRRAVDRDLSVAGRLGAAGERSLEHTVAERHAAVDRVANRRRGQVPACAGRRVFGRRVAVTTLRADSRALAAPGAAILRD